MKSLPSSLGLSAGHIKLLLWAYAALLAYGTWFPADRWDWSLGGLDAFFAMQWPARIGRPDLIINLLVYIPFGLLLALSSSRSRIVLVITASLAGFIFSCLLELGQTYLPGRVTSPSDILLNTCGAGLGAFCAVYVARSPWLINRYERTILQLRDSEVGRLGLGVLLLWVISQWAPFVPSLDVDNIKTGLAPFRQFLGGQSKHFLISFLQYLAMLSGLMALGLRLFKDRELASIYLAAIILGVLFGKVLIMTRQLSPEALLAALCVAVLAIRLRRLQSTSLQIVALAALVTYQSLAALKPGVVDTSLRPINWVPFRGQMNSLNGLVDLLEPLWLFAAYAYLMYPRKKRSSEGLVLRLLLIAPFTLVLELAQQTVPGRYPDVTDVVVGVAAFLVAYSLPLRSRSSHEQPTSGKKQRDPRWRRLAVGAVTGVALLAVLAGLDDNLLRQGYALPALDKLPNPTFPSFRYSHPRLPAPEPDEWAVLLNENPAFINRKRREAESGSYHARIMLARMEPNEAVLNKLFSDLMNLESSSRGHNQAIPIALAYDWLHAQWNPDQRRRLLAKAELACQYQIDVIRNKYELSPYNVILYNQPLQGLMMAAVAIHGDATSGDCMRFTHDYWTKRVLPVWRQVMGKRGGWHEGGEYVGIGIGSAIHRLPAIWRRATGVDLFATMPGLRGFLDFQIQRTRPDGTHMRLGDVAFPTRSVPDLRPLALEYKHAAAYTLSRPPTAPTPLGFPWGPLSDESLNNSQAVERMAKAHWFDGIGLLIARSSWSRDASYVTAKAGNNYWSHMHLDQGSFTIYKGEALAIDSGVYIDYADDHHLNYMYQSIAHNVVTFTDPDDNVPMPQKPTKDAAGNRVSPQPRSIANDGGQRRVGSGWGLPAPLDIHDWIAQRDTYRTVGEVLHSTQPDGFYWLNADLTPAYTNLESGGGDFSARTRRVERYLRTFVYLPSNDLVLVHDRIQLSKEDIRPRWLLHSFYEPAISNGAFLISGERGELRGQVLLPTSRVILPVGGEGFEFFVGDRNYDPEGRALKAIKQQGDRLSNWRIEVLPEETGRNVEYLVAMQASLATINGEGLGEIPAIKLTRGSANIEVLIPRLNKRINLPNGLDKPTLEPIAH